MGNKRRMAFVLFPRNSGALRAQWTPRAYPYFGAAAVTETTRSAAADTDTMTAG